MKRLSVLLMAAVILIAAAPMARAAITDYAFTASSGTFTPLSGATAPALSSGNPDDGYYNGLPIGFTFTYNGTAYTTMSANTNGWMTLGQNITMGGYSNGLTTSGNRPVIAPLWDDMDMASGTFSYKTEGVTPNQIFTAEWRNVEWNYSASGAVISFQVKLYEVDNHIEFVYNQEATAVNAGSASIGITATATGSGNFLSLDGTGPSPSVSSTVETMTLNAKPATGQVYSFALVPMSYVSSTCTQGVTSIVMPGWTNQQIIGIQVVTSGAASPISATQFNLNMTGTTNAADVTNARIYYTGASSTFATTGLFGNQASPSGSYSISGSQALVSGTNYFWLVYDIAAGATLDNVVDAECDSLIVGGTGYIPTVTAPAGSRTIKGPLSGTYTIGAGGSYATLTAASADLSLLGLGGPVVLELMAAYTSAGETFPIAFNQVSGSSAVNTVTIRPAVGATGLAISGSNATGPIINLNGADYLIIDGRPGGLGSTKELTVENTSIANPASAVQFINDATNNTIQYSYLKAGAAIVTSGVVVFSTTTGASGNDNNTITLCDITRTAAGAPTNAFNFNGTAAKENSGNVISSCNIYDWNANAVYMTFNNLNNTFSGNNIYQTAPKTSPFLTGFDLHSTSLGGTSIIGNKFYDFMSSNAAPQLRGIYIYDVSTTVATTIANNIMLFDNTATTDNCTIFGISDAGAANELVNIYYNTFYIGGAPTTGAQNSAGYSRSYSTTAVNFKDNIVYNARANAGATGKHYCIYIGAALGAGLVADYNDLYSSGSGANSLVGYWQTADAATIADWRTASSQDANSLNADPQLISSTNVRPQGGSPVLYAGTPIAGITTDYIGDTRSLTKPSIGAYEKGYFVGDYRSEVSGGDWRTAATWRMWDGGSWVVPARQPGPGNNVLIQAGHTIIFANSPDTCKNLVVEAGALLWNNNSTNRYLNVYGDSVLNNGTIGGAADGFSFQGNNSVKFTGSGTYLISRLRPGVAGATITFARDFELHYAGAALYSYGFADVTYLVNNGITLTFSGSAYFSFSTSSTGPSAVGGTFNIYGTTVMPAGANFNVSVRSGVTSTLQVYGNLTLGDTLIADNDTTTGVEIVIVNGSITYASAVTQKFHHLYTNNVGGVAFGFPVQVNKQLSIGWGNFDITNGLTIADNAWIYRYLGALSAAPVFVGRVNLQYGPNPLAAPITTGYELPAADSTVNNVTFMNPTGIILDKEMTCFGSVNFQDGIVTTDSNWLGCVNQPTRTSGYVAGNLGIMVPAGNSTIDYFVGTANGYSPASIGFNNVTTPNGVGVTAFQTTQPNVNIPGNTMQRYWEIGSDPAAPFVFDSCRISLTYLTADFNTGFLEATDEATMIVGQGDSTGWTFPEISVRTPGGAADGGTIEISNVTAFSVFTMGKDSASIFVQPDTVDPAIAWTTPANGAANVALDAPIKLVFSEPMDTLSVMGNMVPPANDQPVWNATLDTLTLTHDLLAYGTTYTINVTAGTDLAGNPLVTLPDSFTFTTIANQGPAITMTQQPGDTYDGTGPFMVQAVITDPAKRGVASATIYYSFNGLAWNNSPGVPASADTFNFGIVGGQPAGTLVSYYILAADDQGDSVYSPANAPIGVYQFRILNPLPPTALTAQGLDMAVDLSWAPPVQTLAYSTAPASFFNLPAGFIQSTRFTPMHYPCKLEQATSFWYNNAGMDSVIVHVYADDGTGMPDEATPLVTSFRILPNEFPTATVVDLSGYNIVLTSGEFHVCYELVTNNMPCPIVDAGVAGPIRSLYKWIDGIWYGDLDADWIDGAVVSYSSYVKGLALKSSHLRRGQKPNYAMGNGRNLKPAPIAGKQAVQYPKPSGALALAKNLQNYEVLRGGVTGGPYTSLGTASSPTYMDLTAQNGTPYFYVVRANYITPDTFSAYSNEATATPAALPILLVDDDGQVTGNPTWLDVQPYYTAALDSAGYAGQYSVFLKEAGFDGPQSAWYQGRNAVIWFTGYNWNGNLSNNDTLNLAAYLNAGGKLFLCGQDVLYYIGVNSFVQNYLGVQSAVEDVISTTVNLAGMPGSLAEGMAFVMNGTSPLIETYVDNLTIAPGAGYMFDVTAKVGEKPAVQYSNGTFRTAFFAFPFENLVDAASPNTKGELMSRILSWLTTGVEGEPTVSSNLPKVYNLAMCYPNPVSKGGRTTVNFALPKAGNVNIGVYNVMGQKVKTLVNTNLNAGYHSVKWNGQNESGQAVSAGVYLYRMQAEGFSSAKKLVVIR